MPPGFVTTQECDASDAYKQAYINAGKEDIVITQSPVGMPGRAILNPFLSQIKGGTRPAIKSCFQCLEHCDIMDHSLLHYHGTGIMRRRATRTMAFCSAEAMLTVRKKLILWINVMKELTGELA